MKWHANPGKPPKDSDSRWWIKFACGHLSLRPYAPAQLVWKRRGWDFDIDEVARA